MSTAARARVEAQPATRTEPTVAATTAVMPAAAVGAETAESLSVIIPSKNRALLLWQTVDSLLAQVILPDQIIVVDQSCQPAARDRVLACARRCPHLALNYLHAPEVSGAAAARNRGMSLATGAIWLFLDDDVILEPRFTAELLQAYRRQPDATGISGIITNYARPGRLLRLWQQVFFRGSFADDRQRVYWQAADFGAGAALVPVSRLGAGLMSFRAKAIRPLRFDSRLTGSSLAEDVDFCFRLPVASRLFIAPAARLRHLRAGPRCLIHPLQEAAFAAWYLHLGHPHRQRRQSWAFGWLNGGLLMAGVGASLRHWSLGPLRSLWAGAAEGWRVQRGAGVAPARPHRP
ncbi:MAG: glycosyltransferase family 2 protein [Terriglobales bacterium]